MINDQLLGYIKQQLSLNVSKELIANNLRGQGWTDADVAEAFSTITPVVVPVNSTVPPPVASPVSNTSSSKGKKIFAVILALVLLGACSAGAYAYYSGVFVSLPTLFSESIDSARAANSGSYDVTMSVDFSEIKDADAMLSELNLNSKKLTATFKGSYDASDPKNFKNSSTFSADLGGISLAAEIRVLNNTFYGVLTKTPVVAFFPTFSSYEGKWFYFPYKSENGDMLNNPLTSISPINPNMTDKLSADQKEYLYAMFRNAHFIKTVQRLPPETVGGELSYHFVFDLDREGITAYLNALKDYVHSVGKNDSSLSAFDPTDEFNKQLDTIKDFKGEIWIGRNDKLPHKLSVTFGVLPDATKSEQEKITIIGIFSGWNEPVSVVAPADSIPFEELMSGTFGASSEAGKEAGVKANLANLRAEGEIYYDTNPIKQSSYSGFCSSTESKNIQKTISDMGGTGFVCKDKSSEWAAGVKISPNASNWCVDSSGASRSTITLPAGTVCPIK